MMEPEGSAGDALRRVIARRRPLRKRIRHLAAMAGAAVPVAASLIWTLPPLLVWNASASMPRGLYRLIDRAPPERGDVVVARLPPDFAGLAARRRYLPRNVLLVKRIAARAGDRVCADGRSLTVNGRLAASRKMVDGRGRRLPEWRGCVELNAGDYLLLGDSPWSFDGRYFGISRGHDLVWRVALLWRA